MNDVRIDLLKCKKCNQCLKAFESQVTCLLDCSFWMFIAFVFVVVSLSLCFCWLGLVPGTLSPEGAIIKNLKINIFDSEMWQKLKVKSPNVHC